MDNDEYVWKFGFGSNLSIENLENKKSIKVFEWYPCYLTGWALCFNLVFQRKIEPAYANIVPSEKDTVHGSVCRISKENGSKLDTQERTYQIKVVEVVCYDGRKINAEVYVGKETAIPCHIFPSRRYLHLIIAGAKEVGLESDYIEMLESLPYYKPSKQDIEKRKSNPKPSELPSFSIEELAEYNGTTKSEKYASICGYIVKSTSLWGFNYGRDTTFRKLLHFRGISIDHNDDFGKKPFPVLKNLTEDEREYCFQALDDFLSNGEIVGVLKEFWEDQGENQALEF